tara:strand:- start:243 stop:359 length:117 start_codon:yes stop_codon:yes gene_type:complete
MKKTIIFLLLLLFVISCGKKSDPEYKAEDKNGVMVVNN